MTPSEPSSFRIDVAKDTYEPYTLVFTRGADALALGPFDREALWHLAHAAVRRLTTATLEEVTTLAQHQLTADRAEE